MRKHLAALAFATLASGAAAQGVTVTPLGQIPDDPMAGARQQVYFTYEKDPGEEESRLVFVVELRDAATDAVLASATQDNGGLGFGGSAGTTGVELAVPEEAGGIYYRIHAAPWSLNKWMVEKLESYPTDGTFTYEWTAGHYGVTQDLYYLNQRIAISSGRNVTYCSGVAFEVFLLGYLEYNAEYGHPNIGGMSWSNMETFRRLWYGTRADLDPELKLAALAIPTWNLGVEITDWDEVQPGDFVQLWRHSGSGHNPIFLGWERDNSGQIIGLRYWGSQGSTNGIGVRSEFFGTNSGVNPARTFFGRLRKPRDTGDVDHALGFGDTETLQLGLAAEVAEAWMIY